MSRILIIEDERPMRTALTDTLTAEGYRVLAAADGAEGLEKAVNEKPDLILLDVMMPQLDGFAVCTALRRLNIATPVLMLTAKGQVGDRVNGLDAGSDDYLVKPFSMEELLARVRALLRRSTKNATTQHRLVFGNATIDLLQQTAVRGRQEFHLTAKEFDAAIARRRGRRADFPRAFPGCCLGLRRVSDHAHRGQSHREFTIQDRT
jgi:DNA-binding response OmpR family regulator